MLRTCALILLWFLSYPHGLTTRAVSPPNASQQIAAQPVAIAGGRFGALEVLEAWHLTSPNHDFGGFSAMSVDDDRGFMLLSDTGMVARFRLREDGDVRSASITPLPGLASRRKSASDSEAATTDPQSGQIWLAFEGVNRIARYSAGLARAEASVAPPELRRWSLNSGPEAMARLTDGRFLILSEGADVRGGGMAAVLYPGDPTTLPAGSGIRFTYHAWGMGKVTDAAPLPDGRVLLLHRQLGPWRRFTSVLAIADPAGIRRGTRWTARPIASIGLPQLSDNFEALAIRPHPRGISIWVASDDNLMRWQRSLLLHLLLPTEDIPPR
jgi:hypothetical protein